MHNLYALSFLKSLYLHKSLRDFTSNTHLFCNPHHDLVSYCIWTSLVIKPKTFYPRFANILATASMLLYFPRFYYKLAEWYGVGFEGGGCMHVAWFNDLNQSELHQDETLLFCYLEYPYKLQSCQF